MSPDQRQRTPHPAAPAENEPLGRIPDGGLARAMPDWLREAPPEAAAPGPRPSGDPAGFITADDMPPWLRRLAAADTPAAARTDEASSSLAPAPSHDRPAPAAPIPHRTARPDPTPSEPPLPATPPPRPPAAIPAKRRPEDHRALVAVAGFVVLALAVLAYLYARGAL